MGILSQNDWISVKKDRKGYLDYNEVYFDNSRIYLNNDPQQLRRGASKAWKFLRDSFPQDNITLFYSGGLDSTIALLSYYDTFKSWNGLHVVICAFKDFSGKNVSNSYERAQYICRQAGVKNVVLHDLELTKQRVATAKYLHMKTHMPDLSAVLQNVLYMDFPNEICVNGTGFFNLRRKPFIRGYSSRKLFLFNTTFDLVLSEYSGVIPFFCINEELSSYQVNKDLYNHFYNLGTDKGYMIFSEMKQEISKLVHQVYPESEIIKAKVKTIEVTKTDKKFQILKTLFKDPYMKVEEHAENDILFGGKWIYYLYQFTWTEFVNDTMV